MSVVWGLVSPIGRLLGGSTRAFRAFGGRGQIWPDKRGIELLPRRTGPCSRSRFDFGRIAMLPANVTTGAWLPPREVPRPSPRARMECKFFICSLSLPFSQPVDLIEEALSRSLHYSF